MVPDYLDARTANRVIKATLVYSQPVLADRQRHEKLYEMLDTLSYRLLTGARSLTRREGEERTGSLIRARLIEDTDLLLSDRIISVVLISLILISG